MNNKVAIVIVSAHNNCKLFAIVLFCGDTLKHPRLQNHNSFITKANRNLDLARNPARLVLSRYITA